MPSAASFREIVSAMGELMKEGKIRGYGACNDNAVGLMGMYGAARELGKCCDETGGLAPRETLGAIGRQQHPPRQVGGQKQAGDHAEREKCRREKGDDH